MATSISYSFSIKVGWDVLTSASGCRFIFAHSELSSGNEITDTQHICSQSSCHPTKLQSSFHPSKLQSSFHPSKLQPSFLSPEEWSPVSVVQTYRICTDSGFYKHVSEFKFSRPEIIVSHVSPLHEPLAQWLSLFVPLDGPLHFPVFFTLSSA